MIDSLFRKLPSFKGKRRLANLFIKRDTAHYRDVIVKGKFGCSFVLPNIKENIGFEIFINGVYERETIELIVSMIPKNGVMIDVGANIGTIVLPVCKLRNDIKAIAVEGSPRVFGYLSSNKERNKVDNCTIINKAIMDTDSDAIQFYSPIEQFGIGMVAPGFTEDAETTSGQTLTSLVDECSIDKIDLIKIDIEGYEYFAFKGAKRILERDDAPVILFEFAAWAEELAKDISPGAAQRILLEYGYDLYHINGNGTITYLQTPMTAGTCMLLASKQKI